MSELLTAEGSCLCGAVTLKTTTMSQQLGACHCGMCRKWGGGPFLEVDCGQGVEIDGEDHVTVFDSSEWAERGFCKKCGTHLFYRLKEQQEYHLPVGLFGDSISPVFTLQVFIDRKPEYYTFAEETEKMTEAQIYEMYAPKD
ncbi:MAG: GFA family protein [Thermodesulfobacteriota bacterium]